MRQAVILAGGKGTRLLSRSGGLPKALIDIGGVPLLGHQLRLLQEHGFTRVLLLVNYLAEAISDYCRSSAHTGLEISIACDGEARGTAGAVLHALPQLDEQFAVLYGDTMLNVDLTRFWNWHVQHAHAAASLFLHPNDHPQDSDLVEVDENGRILQFHSYPHPKEAYLPNLVNAALYILRRSTLSSVMTFPKHMDFAKELFPKMLQNGALLLGYLSPEYIKDAGTPNRLDKVREDWISGKIARSSLAVTQGAVFIDRDGTINEERGHINCAENLSVFESVGPALRRLNDAGWRTVLITNQPVLARGEATADDLRRIHAKLDTILAYSGAFLDRKYFCPHHPDSGFSGEVSALKIACRCRKPAPGLVFQAQKDLNLNLAESWLIGDSMSDIGAAKAAGVTSIYVQTGPSCHPMIGDLQPDFIEANFASAVDLILNYYPRMAASCRTLLPQIEPNLECTVASSCLSDQTLATAVLKRELVRSGRKANIRQFDRRLSKPEHLIFVECSHLDYDGNSDLQSLIELQEATVIHSWKLPPRVSESIPVEEVLLEHAERKDDEIGT